MLKAYFNTLRRMLGKSKAHQPSTVLIAISPELFEKCTRFNVTPEAVINDFVDNICRKDQQVGSSINEAAGYRSVYEYLSHAYGNMRMVNSQAVQQKRAAV